MYPCQQSLIIRIGGYYDGRGMGIDSIIRYIIYTFPFNPPPPKTNLALHATIAIIIYSIWLRLNHNDIVTHACSFNSFGCFFFMASTSAGARSSSSAIFPSHADIESAILPRCFSALLPKSISLSKLHLSTHAKHNIIILNSIGSHIALTFVEAWILLR